MHTTRDIAQRLDINAQTVRRWSEQFSDHLSGERSGDAWQFTDDDLLLLWSVRRWRQLGYSHADIAQRIGQGERVSEPLPDAPASDEPARALLIPEAQFTAALAEIKRLEGERERLLIERDRAAAGRDDLTQQIRGLERELGELRGKLAILEDERRPLAFWLITLALAVAVTGLIILGAVALGRG